MPFASVKFQVTIATVFGITFSHIVIIMPRLNLLPIYFTIQTSLILLSWQPLSVTMTNTHCYHNNPLSPGLIPEMYRRCELRLSGLIETSHEHSARTLSLLQVGFSREPCWLHSIARIGITVGPLSSTVVGRTGIFLKNRIRERSVLERGFWKSAPAAQKESKVAQFGCLCSPNIKDVDFTAPNILKVCLMLFYAPDYQKHSCLSDY